MIVAYKKNLVEQHIQDIVVCDSTTLPPIPPSLEIGCWGSRLAHFPFLGLEWFEHHILWDVGRAAQMIIGLVEAPFGP